MINLKEFKQAVLQKAMQGKLTKQLPNDGNARELLKPIFKRKHFLLKNKRIRNHKRLPEIHNIPFNIPNNWQWIRLLSLYDFINGRQPPKSQWISNNKKGYIRMYKIRDYGPNPKPIYIPKSTVRQITHEGDILAVNHGSSIGKVLHAHFGTYTGNMARITPITDISELYKDFLWYYLKSNLYLLFISSIHRSAQPCFNRYDLEKLLIPVPPLAEQQRIVSKVHKCFLLADTIQKERDLHQKFAHDMKQSLLLEAMKGHLTQQLPSDGNADDLLQSIQQKKQQLIQAGKIRKHKKLLPISKDEIPFKIPQDWKWVRLNSVGSWKAGSTPRRNHPDYYNGNIPWIKSGDLNDGFITNSSEHISKTALTKSSLRLNPKNSVLIAMYGQGKTLSKLGILRIRATTNQAICACIPYCIDSQFLFFYLLSQRNNIISLGVGGARPNISRTKIIRYPFPLPPVSEQHRIVSKLHDLFNTINA